MNPKYLIAALLMLGLSEVSADVQITEIEEGATS